LEKESARRTRRRPREAPRFVDVQLCPCRRTLTLDYQAQNFFEEQQHAQEDASVFLLCHVLHDWADEYCVTILKHLRAAAGPKTQLVILEQLVACVCDEPVTHEIPGAEVPVPPKPLLRNLGRAESMVYNMDLLVRNAINSNYDN